MKQPSVDVPLFFTFLGLVLFGLVMMSSISVAQSFALSGENDFYFWRHFRHVIFGIPLFLIALKFPYENLRKLSFLLYLLSIVLLLGMMFFGESYGTTAKLWLRIGPVSFQPIEIMKLSLAIFMGSVFSSEKRKISTFDGGLIPFLFILGIPAILLMSLPDFGALFVLGLIAGSIYFVSGANLKHIFGTLIFGFLATSIIILTNDYIASRFKTFFNPELDPLGAGFQVKQALIAIGSGGIFGRGFQNSVQKYDYLPEVQSDTIFSAISEEMGFVRILVLVGLYLFMAYRGFFIAKNAPTPFTQYLAIGITVWIVGQAFLNIAVNLALFPNTGITLPFISYGGTSLWMVTIAMGILLHISTEIKKPMNRRYFWK